MKRVLSFLFFVLLFLVCIPFTSTADIDPTPFPPSLLEAQLSQYLHVPWESQGMSYLFTGTPYDSDIFAALYDGENYIFTIMTVMDGNMQNCKSSNCAIFQEPVTSLYLEIENEIYIFFQSGSWMRFVRNQESDWRLSDYTRFLENGASFNVTMYEGPLTAYSYEDPISGVNDTGLLCGRLHLDNSFEKIDAQQLPCTLEDLKSIVTQKSSSEFYILDKVFFDDDTFLVATCGIHDTTADICIYATNEITRFDQDTLVRVIGFDIYIDGIFQETIPQEFNSKYGFYNGNTDFSMIFYPDTNNIAVVPRWDDGTADLIHSFVFQIK